MPLTSGPKDFITDVAGVHVSHFTVASGELQTGVTAILPYPLSVRNRKLFLGSCARGDWNEWTGLHVAQDFGTFSSPIVLCNATTVGIAYDALISFGHAREQGLPIDNAWPPIVIGIDDGYLNDLRQRPISHDEILRTIHAAKDEAMSCGSVGIGRGLCAFGGKGGVGAASRLVQVGKSNFILGAFIAANGGQIHAEQNVSSLAPSIVAIIATDAPLFPPQLRQLAEAGMRGLDRLDLISASDQQLALAFSTTNTMDGAFESFKLFEERWLANDQLMPLWEATAECGTAALHKAVKQTEAVAGRKGRTVKPVELNFVQRVGR